MWTFDYVLSKNVLENEAPCRMKNCSVTMDTATVETDLALTRPERRTAQDVVTKINTVATKIDIERKTQAGARAMLPNLTDETLKEQCEATIADSEKRVQFLEGELQKLQLRKNMITGDEEVLGSISGATTSGFSPSNTLQRSKGRRKSDPNTKGARKSGVKSDMDGGVGTGRENDIHPSLDRFAPKEKTRSQESGDNTDQVPILPSDSTNLQVLSDFDYLKAETAITREKIKYKLAEVETKLDIEQKVQAGTERMWQVMKQQPQTDGDQRQYLVEEKLMECQSKVTLLSKSRQRYKGLDLDDMGLPMLPNEEAAAAAFSNMYKISKRPQSGRLFLKFLVANALPNKMKYKSETFAVIKVDGVQKAQTKPSLTNKWMEDFEIPVEKALEVELCVYEKGGGILALVWFKLAELETMQRLSVLKQAVTSVEPGTSDGAIKENANEVPSVSQGKTSKAGMEVWLDLEPAGKLAVKINFVAVAGKLQRRNKTIMRNAPVQKVFPKKGHKLAPTSFYQVMKCAVCYEFLVSAQGYQCQACKYTCHKKCQPRVFSKCITLGETEKGEEGGEDQLMRHKIPHRFEETYSLGLNWCCHCGYMLPLTKKECKRCSECGITAHTTCSLLVPSLCGLNSDLIDQMKKAIDQAEKLKKEKEIMKAEKAKATKDESEKKPASVVPVKLPPAPFDDNETRRHVADAASTTKPSTSSRPAPRGIGLDDFNLLAVLGKGNFGKVMLAEEKLTKQHYAIKVLKKDFVIENDEAEATRSEKRVFMTANIERFPFLVNLHSCFQTETRLYFVMEFVSGGDLMWHIQHERFSEKRAKYYACEVLLALEYFHKNNITYRDLKLDNILLTLEGHIKIADYGLCKENMVYGATTSTFCGTPEFMAPEILKEKPYTRAVDWWALGVLIYEMILGQSPFPGDGEDQIFDAILHDDVLFPGNMNKDAVDLLKKLLTKEPLARLGAGLKDAVEIKSHPYFKDVNWDDVLNLRIPPPFFPSVRGPTDISNFDEEFTKEAPVLTPINMVLSTADQEEFRGFTHISDWAQQNRTKARDPK
ncbi:kinase-like domain-containing protein [Chytriomyces sp. MP71]|nr:kinase-like domain-containing protein [Chytriomyces sp. MP71]